MKQMRLPIVPASPDLWRKFIDPVDWQKAIATFPREPWRLYIKPFGEFDEEHWHGYVNATQWIWEKALHARASKDYSLSLKDVLTTHSLVLTGKTENWEKSLRNYRPIFNRRTQDEINAVYDNQSCRYKNEDSLDICIDGFANENCHSIDFFLVCRNLSKTNYHKSPEQWLALHKQFMSHLQLRADGSSSSWNTYYLSNTAQLTTQIESILAWYYRSIDKILTLSENANSRSNAVLELAVKMQRYLDICQFCLDGSSRTSRLIYDYIFLLFGFYPPLPVIYHYKGLPYANGTYLPLTNAVEMALLGWNCYSRIELSLLPSRSPAL